MKNAQKETTEDFIKQKELEFSEKCKEIAIEEKCGEVTFEYAKDKKTGELYVAYFKQPHEITAARAMDVLSRGNMFEAGQMLWEGCFLRKWSSPEIESKAGIKLGMKRNVGLMLDIQLPELKKN